MLDGKTRLRETGQNCEIGWHADKVGECEYKFS